MKLALLIAVASAHPDAQAELCAAAAAAYERLAGPTQNLQGEWVVVEGSVEVSCDAFDLMPEFPLDGHFEAAATWKVMNRERSQIECTGRHQMRAFFRRSEWQLVIDAVDQWKLKKNHRCASAQTATPTDWTGLPPPTDNVPKSACAAALKSHEWTLASHRRKIAHHTGEQWAVVEPGVTIECWGFSGDPTFKDGEVSSMARATLLSRSGRQTEQVAAETIRLYHNGQSWTLYESTDGDSWFPVADCSAGRCPQRLLKVLGVVEEAPAFEASDALCDAMMDLHRARIHSTHRGAIQVVFSENCEGTRTVIEWLDLPSGYPARPSSHMTSSWIHEVNYVDGQWVPSGLGDPQSSKPSSSIANQLGRSWGRLGERCGRYIGSLDGGLLLLEGRVVGDRLFGLTILRDDTESSKASDCVKKQLSRLRFSQDAGPSTIPVYMGSVR